MEGFFLSLNDFIWLILLFFLKFNKKVHYYDFRKLIKDTTTYSRAFGDLSFNRSVILCGPDGRISRFYHK
jgi:hypothetical protein